MATTTKLDTSTLRDFSARLCRFYKFPHGTQVILWDKKKNRKVRDDCLLKHVPVNKKTLSSMPRPECTIAEFLRDYVESLLLTVDLKVRGHEIRLHGPDDLRCAGNKTLKSLVKLPAKETEREQQKRLAIEAQILVMRGLIAREIKTMAPDRSTPPQAVCRAYVEALIGHFGFDVYFDAFTQADI